MLKTVKHGSGIRVGPPPCFFKIPTFSRFFFGNVPIASFLFLLVFFLNMFVNLKLEFYCKVFVQILRRDLQHFPCVTSGRSCVLCRPAASSHTLPPGTPSPQHHPRFHHSTETPHGLNATARSLAAARAAHSCSTFKFKWSPMPFPLAHVQESLMFMF